MSSEHGQEGQDEHNALVPVGGAWESFLATASSALQNNIVTAIHRLGTTATDLGVAKIQHYVAATRAGTKNHEAISTALTDQIVKRMEVDPAYLQAITTKFASEILGKRLNVENVLGYGLEEVQKAPKVEAEPKDELNADWLNAFEDEAGKASSEQLQRHFGRILAGEIKQPGAFSIRTVRLMAQLDTRVAERFSRLCSLSVSLRVPGRLLDARVIAVGDLPAANGLAVYGLNFDDLNVLHEYGLIIPEYASSFPYSAAFLSNNLYRGYFTHQRRTYALKPLQPVENSEELMVRGVALSTAGRELASIVEPVPSPDFTAAMTEYFKRKGYSLILVDPPVHKQT